MNKLAPQAVPAQLTEFKRANLVRELFTSNLQQLLKIVDAAWHARSPDDWGPHPMFGKMTLPEWGKLLQVHIDYHLKQFAA